MNRKKLLLILSLLAVGLLVFTGCSGGGDEAASNDNGKGTIVVGSKNFNENIILGELMAQLIEAKMDVNVERKSNLGGTFVCFQALKKGDLDVYADYTGTGLLAVLKKDVIKDPDKVYDIVQKEYNKQFNIKWMKPLGFNNTYAIAVRKETAEKNSIETISDLQPLATDMKWGSEQEFMNREDGLPGVKKEYNLEFASESNMETALKYQAIAKKNIDVTDAFSTDGELIKYDLKILKDDKGFFPPYYCAPTVNMDTLEKYPQLEDVLNQLAGKITNEEMQKLNYLVAVEGKTKEEVANQFLKDKDLIN